MELLIVIVLFVYFYYTRNNAGINEGMETEDNPADAGFPKKAFVINLEKNAERYSTFMKDYNASDFKKNPSLTLSRFNAVNGKKINAEQYLTDSAIKELHEVETAKYRTKHYQLTRGGVGCFLSQMRLCEQLLNDKETDSYLLFEDDAKIPKNANHLIELAFKNAPKDWHILSFSHIRLVPENNKATNGFIVPRAFWGTQCYIINKQGAKVLLDEVEKNKMDGQIDSYLSVMSQEKKIKIYVYNKNIITTTSTTTDIQKPLREFADVNPFLYKGYLV